MAEPMKKLYVKDYMSPRLVTLSPDMEVVRASRKMMTHDVTGAPVVDDAGNLVGLLTEKDCMKVVLNAVYHGEFGGLVRDFMATDIEVMHVDDPLIDAARRFYEQRFLRYPVMQNDRLVGVISRTDIVRAMGDFWDRYY